MKRATFHTEQLRRIGVAQRVDWAANPWVWVLTFRRVADGGVWHGTERPIIFSARMVNALIANAKTQTRRPNGLPNADPDRPRLGQVAYQANWSGKPGKTRRTVAIFGDSIPDDPAPLEVVCPFGNVGDRLWVREGVRKNLMPKSKPVAHFIADGAFTNIERWRWKNSALPAIHMPRGVCRLVLEITEIRCERLQSITEADALAEGISRRVVGFGSGITYRYAAPGVRHTRADGERDHMAHAYDSAREAFSVLWTSIHGEAP